MRDLTYDPAAIDPRVAKAVELAHHDILRVREQPMGSSRSPIIDEYNSRFGSPLASYWCGNALGAWWQDGGLEIPKVPGAVRNWRPWAEQTDRWRHYPVVGAAVIYGEGTNANHCGLLYDVQSPVVLFSIEGNTSLDGYSRNGELVTGKIVRLSHVLGYVHPFPAAR